LNQVIAGKGWNQIGPFSFPRGLDIKLTSRSEFVVSCVLFLLYEVALSGFVWLFRENKNALCAVRVIGGHLTAFAGIITFGTLQVKAEENGFTSHHHGWVVVMSIAIASLFRSVVSIARQGVFKDRHLKTSSGASSNVGERQPRTETDRDVAVERAQESRQEAHDRFDPKELTKVISEAENDAFSLIFGFLFTQVIVFQTTGHLMPLESSQHFLASQHHVYIMYAFFAGSLGFLWVAYFVVKCFLKEFLTSDDKSDLKSAIKDCVPLTFLFTASWTALVAVTWQVDIWLQHTPLSSYEMSEVCAAFFLTVSAVLCIVGLDKISDHFLTKATELDEDPDKKLKLFSKLVRKVIEALAVLVGLSWEKACHGALDTVIESIPVLESHKVYSSLGAALMLSAYILPAWYYHILPMAEKNVEHHETSINVALFHRVSSEGSTKEARIKAAVDYLENMDYSTDPPTCKCAKTSESRKTEFRKTLGSLAEMAEIVKHLRPSPTLTEPLQPEALRGNKQIKNNTQLSARLLPAQTWQV